MQKKKIILSTLLATILVLSISTTIQFAPDASAHNPPQNILTSSFIHVAPNPAGIGQTITIGFWLNQPPPTANGPYGDRYTNMTVKITMPDGTTKTLGPFTTDDTGGTYTTFTPSITGTYSFQMFFAGETLAGNNLSPSASSAIKAWVGDYFMPSQSDIVTLTVQDEPVSGIPSAALPTSYWESANKFNERP